MARLHWKPAAFRCNVIAMQDTQRRIALVIEDDPEERAALSILLGDAGFEVVALANGKAGVHYLTSNHPEPSIIVTDLAMPDMSGWEFINILQAYVRLAVIPVLVVSGHELKKAPVREEGVLEFFSKPLDTKRFLGAVQRHAVTSAQIEERRRASARKLARAPF